MLSYLTEIDGDNHFALIAIERDRPDRLVAVARFVRYRDRPTEAEFAITVHDPYQGRGSVAGCSSCWSRRPASGRSRVCAR